MSAVNLFNFENKPPPSNEIKSITVLLALNQCFTCATTAKHHVYIFCIAVITEIVGAPPTV